MQMKTGTFEGGFSKNTIYRFLNNARTNWQRFTTLLSASMEKSVREITEAFADRLFEKQMLCQAIMFQIQAQDLEKNTVLLYHNYDRWEWL